MTHNEQVFPITQSAGERESLRHAGPRVVVVTVAEKVLASDTACRENKRKDPHSRRERCGL